MKTALCLSGHLRTFRHTADSLKKNIIDPLSCDVFIHTWDIIGAPPSPKTPGDNNYRNNLTVELLGEINNLYQPALMSIEEEKPKLDELKFRAKDIVVPAGQQQYIMQHIGLHTSMFYSMYMSNELRKEHEQENYLKYDLVIRCRPDMFLSTKLDYSMFPNKDTIYVPEIATYCEGGINDQMAIGTPALMDKYFNIYHDVENYYRHHSCVARPEIMIKYHLNRNGIKTEERNILYDIYRLDGSILKQHKMYAELIHNANFGI